MASTAHSVENDDYAIVQYLIAGFIGQLKGWWENMLSDRERLYIMQSINEIGEQNAGHRLIYSITKHFIGDPRVLQEGSSEILKNLRCVEHLVILDGIVIYLYQK